MTTNSPAGNGPVDRVVGRLEEAYLRTVAELQELARNAPHVTQEWVLDVASMDPMEMRRRLIRSNDWHGHFAHSLDGIPEIQTMPGGGIDGCRSHKEVRAIVLGLLRQIDRMKTPNVQIEAPDAALSRQVASNAGLAGAQAEDGK